MGLLAALMQLVFVVLAVATLRNAVRRQQLPVWAGILTYGLAMETLALTSFDTYVHAAFAVSLWGGQVPVYIIAFYVVHLYIAMQVAGRLAPGGGWPTAVLAGLIALGLSAPFDLVGEELGWWAWSDLEPAGADRLFGVPLIHSYWSFSFAAVLTRALRWVRSRPLYSGCAVVTGSVYGVLCAFAGFLAFVPLHTLVALGMESRDAVLLLVALAAGFAATGVSLKPRPADRGLGGMALGYALFIAACGLTLLAVGRISPWATAVCVLPLLAVGATGGFPSRSAPRPPAGSAYLESR